jgi:hypothetical protein
MELVVGETLSFKTGLLCTVVSVSFGVSGRTAKVLTSAVIPMPQNMPMAARSGSPGPIAAAAGMKRFSHETREA